jgi:PhnB protein
MANQSLSEQLDKIVEALVARPNAASSRREPKVGARLQPLATIAAQLRDLPGAEFKARLKLDLERRTSMASKPVTAAEVRQTAVPYLCVKDAAAAIDFYKSVFGAVEVMRLVGPGTRIGHAEIRIGNSLIYLSDEFPDHGALSPETLGGSPVKISLSVDDVDAVAARAVAAGAKEVRPIEDQFYGERSGQFADPFGYVWNISTVKEKLSGAEMQKRIDDMMGGASKATSQEKPQPTVAPIRPGFHTITPYLIVPGAAAMIDFVKQAFGAVEIFRVNVPGTNKIMHAEVRIGDSMLELADASEQYPGRPCGMHLYVPDTDALYEHAIKAGATSVRTPEDTPYGDRSAIVTDAFGNSWFIATHIKDVKF